VRLQLRTKPSDLRVVSLASTTQCITRTEKFGRRPNESPGAQDRARDPESRESGYLPSFVNLQALLSRLSRICLSRMESAVSGATFSFASTKEMREEPEQPVKLPHLHNLGSPAYLEPSGMKMLHAPAA